MKPTMVPSYTIEKGDSKLLRSETHSLGEREIETRNPLVRAGRPPLVHISWTVAYEDL